MIYQTRHINLILGKLIKAVTFFFLEFYWNRSTYRNYSRKQQQNTQKPRFSSEFARNSETDLKYSQNISEILAYLKILFFVFIYFFLRRRLLNLLIIGWVFVEISLIFNKQYKRFRFNFCRKNMLKVKEFS